MKKQIESTGKSVEEAIRNGLAELMASRDDVEVKVLQVETPRLFGLLGKTQARVRLTCLESDDKATAVRLTREIIGLMGMQAEVSARDENGQILVEIRGGGDLLTGQQGRPLDALQYLVSRVVNTGRKDEEWTRINIDLEGYRDKRTDALEGLARKLARQAVEQGREIITDPMPAHDRRVIHLTLKPEKDVETFSRGQGEMRRVVISPKEKRRYSA
ncbi:MAG TPA: RNA-binding cell elongation regulator Jag/EloR, partial [bacterium]|nr:RNA-binding cell elongation regulator Jag/EloR [bacterium]